MKLALIEGLRQIVSLYDYCEAHGLITEYDREFYNLLFSAVFDF